MYLLQVDGPSVCVLERHFENPPKIVLRKSLRLTNTVAVAFLFQMCWLRWCLGEWISGLPGLFAKCVFMREKEDILWLFEFCFASLYYLRTFGHT